MKSLNRVQKAAKIIRILLKIGYIASIAGATCCVIGAILCGVLSGNEAFREALASAEKTLTVKEAAGACVCAAIDCGFSIALCALSLKFYDHELAAGTPFEKSLAKEMRSLGLYHIILPVCAAIVTGIVASFLKLSADFSETAGVSAGIAYLLLSLLLDYGADVKSGAEKNGENENPVSGNRDSGATSGGSDNDGQTDSVTAELKPTAPADDANL